MITLAPRVLDAATGMATSPSDFEALVAGADGWLAGQGIAGERIAFVPRADVASLALLAACFLRGTPVIPIHARATETERAALLAGLDPSARVIDVPVARAHVSAWRPLLDERTLVIVPTSGTTGDPKGVILSARAFEASYRASQAREAMRADDVALLTLPLAHVGGLSLFFRASRAGATLVLPESGPYDPARIAAVIDRHSVTQLSLVPTMLARHLDEGAMPKRGTLRRVLVGGAAADESLLARALAGGLPVRTTYGLTEACSQVATRARAEDRGVGAPLPGTEVRIEAERILVRGATLLTGYLERGAVVSALREDGFFVTTDLGALDDDGFLHVHGRASDLIITGGENVMPAEVERALLALPGVRAAVVVGVPDPTWGERVVASVVANEGTSEDALAEALRGTLARHKVPAIRIDDAHPLLPSGKVDRRAVAASFRQR